MQSCLEVRDNVLDLQRALYHDSSLLVLDEATSALDVDMENKIIKEVEKLKKEKIIILVAHRVKTLDVCDEIITLSNSELTKSLN